MGFNSSAVSQRLVQLAEQLRLHNNPIERPKNAESAANSASKTPERSGRSKRAAVLICIFEDVKGDLRVILTKRSMNLSMNAGDVALPGGKTEEGDADDVETALREAKEEIGLDPSLVDVVAVLQPMVTKVGMAVVPVIGILANRKAFIPTLSTAEVEAVFDAPLLMFLKDENRRAEEREWMRDKYLLQFFNYQADDKSEYVIWALTAGILIQAASLVYQRPPDFQERRPVFWTRKNC